jgi:magnesium-protoporphyrin O-methyltransferase
MDCCQVEGIEEFMDERMAEGELKQYRRRGPDHTTQALLDALQAEGVKGKTLLDIGGGVGAIQHEMLKAGAAQAVSVDASSAYLAAAWDEAEAEGHSDRITQHHGDFVEIASSLSPADIVTLDRVICCYDDMAGLVSRSVNLASVLYGVVYPNDRWYISALTRLENFYMRLRGSQFRGFVHATAAVDRLIREAGLERVFRHETLLWHVHLYRRSATA